MKIECTAKELAELVRELQAQPRSMADLQKSSSDVFGKTFIAREIADELKDVRKAQSSDKAQADDVKIDLGLITANANLRCENTLKDKIAKAEKAQRAIYREIMD